MKKTVIASALAAAVVGVLTAASGISAAPNYGMAGCGLGSLVFKENAAGSQILAATTNGTGIQTFGITTGTSNCADDSAAFIERRREHFVAVNYRSLQQESAAGQGERLSAFASLMGCPADQFGRVAQARHSSLFGNANATPDEFLASLKEAIRNDGVLAASCAI